MSKKQNWVTMLTPFTQEGAVDYPAIDDLVEWYITKGIDGIFAVCQSSEMFFLTLEERLKTAKRVMDAVNARIPVVVSGHISSVFSEQIQELREMAGIDAKAVVLVTNRLAEAEESDESWIANARRVLEAIPEVKFGLYECPYPYKRLLSERVLRWCAKTGRFLFLKDTCCDLALLKRRIAILQGTGLKLYNANSTTLLESLRAGADGFCGVMLNFHPDLYVYLLKHFEKDTKKVRLCQQFATIASMIEKQLYPVNAKYSLSLNGVKITNVSRACSAHLFTDTMKEEIKQLNLCWNTLKNLIEIG